MLIRRESGDGSWHSPHTTAYTNEAELRDLLVETPSLLPGVDERAVAAKELPISGVGSADVVVVDASGEITVVECKLRANPEIRRRVIGQLLAYSSGIWRMSFATFDDAFRRSETRQSLSDALLGGSDLEEEEFRRAVEDNLMSGSMRLIIAVDEITDELKRIVSYLNSHTTANVELLALEMRRAAGDGIEVLVPTLANVQEIARRRTAQAAASLDNELFGERETKSWRTTVRGHLRAALDALPAEEQHGEIAQAIHNAVERAEALGDTAGTARN